MLAPHSKSHGASMSPKIMVKDLEVKQEITSAFLVKIINLAQARDGKSYLNIILSDSTGDVEARIWNNAQKIFDHINRGDFAQVKGKVNFYQGRKQVVISSIERLEKESVHLEDYIQAGQSDPEKMFEDLLNIVDSLKDVYIKSLLQNILADPEISRRLKTWQAGKSIHHAYQGGLLEHILSCTQLAVHLSSFYQVNQSYVVAGAILHDICKIYELSDGLTVDYTEEGKLVGHLVKSLEVLDRFAYKIPGFPYSMKLHLKHILLSHHGEYEFGSPKTPMTMEAYLVHLIDLMDSKMNTLKSICQNDQTPGHWSGYNRNLDRMIYKDELPTFNEFLAEKNSTPIMPPTKSPKIEGKELKQNLGKLLEGFKIED